MPMSTWLLEWVAVYIPLLSSSKFVKLLQSTLRVAGARCAVRLHLQPRRTSSTTTDTMHDSTSAPHGTHDKRSRQKSLTKTNLKGLLKFLAAVCVLEGAGASSTRELSTVTSSAQPTNIPGALSPCLVPPRTSPEASPLTTHLSTSPPLPLPHLHRSPLTPHLSP